MAKDIFMQANLVDLSDDALLETVGFLFEESKRLDERAKADPKLQRMLEDVQHYRKEMYTDVKKTYKAKLKAARKLAEARGLHFKLPDEARDEEG